ncbi:acyl carrier protein [Mesorhizobium sp. 1B3]|uniref:acyl carrier protein n=1 Tax=Mesorhizobium sp. 1B3 TaxID=3243599 RepID=UPI003D97C670
MTTTELASIQNVIIDDILLDGLDLADLGYEKDQISGATPLFDETNGLGLDSLAALEVAVAVQQKFGFKIETLDRAFFETNCVTVDTLARYVAGRLS